MEEQGLPNEMNPSESNRKAWEIASWVALSLTLLTMLFTIIMIRRINIAVGCLKVRRRSEIKNRTDKGADWFADASLNGG